MMTERKHSRTSNRLVAMLLLMWLWPPSLAWGHCDTMDGPVVADARKALESADITPVLKWVRPQEEAEVRAAFRQAQAVRSLSTEAKQLADLYFFETVVRVHRMGEGVPYTGLKPAGAETNPAIRAADHAIASDSLDGLAMQMSGNVAQAMQQRFGALMEKKRQAQESVAKGREFVAAYAEFIHFVETLHMMTLAEQKETAAGSAHKHQRE